MRVKYTDEDRKWGMELISRTGDNPTPARLNDIDAVELYHKRFGGGITVTGLSTWLRRMQFPDKQREYDRAYYRKRMMGSGGKVKDSGNKLLKLLEQSKFILYVFGMGVYGFDTKDEVKEYLIQVKPQNPIRLFTNVPAGIKVNIEVEI